MKWKELYYTRELKNREFLIGNNYKAQNLIYDLMDLMSENRDYEIFVSFEVKDDMVEMKLKRKEIVKWDG